MREIILLFLLLSIISCSEEKSQVSHKDSNDTLERYIKEKNISINFATAGELNPGSVSNMKRVPGGYKIILDKSYWDTLNDCKRKVMLEDLKSRTGSFGIFSASESLEEQYRIRCK